MSPLGWDAQLIRTDPRVIGYGLLFFVRENISFINLKFEKAREGKWQLVGLSLFGHVL